MADAVPAARITAPVRSLSVRGQWAPGLAGGCPKNETFGSNPQFVLKPSKPAAFEIEVSQPASAQTPLLPIGIALVRNKPGKPFKAPLSKKKLVAKTMSWRSESSNYCSITLEPLPDGEDYVILPSTFKPDQYGDFTIKVISDSDDGFTLVPRDENAIAVSAAGTRKASSSDVTPRAAVGAGAAKAREPPAPPVGALSAATDPVLAAAMERSGAQRDGDGRFDDDDFPVKARTSGKDVPNSKVLYSSGTGGNAAIKVDSFGRLASMSGKGGATSLGFTVPSSLMEYRRGLRDLQLLNAIAMVQTRRGLMERLLGYADESLGMHAVRLFKDGEWRTVVVDDQIPCHGKLKPAYSTNVDPRDGPVAIIEKALAKLYGCYELLANGRVGLALEDLTGGFKDHLYLVDGVMGKHGVRKQPDIRAADEVASGAMWARLGALFGDHHLLGAAFKRKYAHLGSESVGSAPAISPDNLEEAETLVYPILELRQLGSVAAVAAGGGQFVRMRNVWKQVAEGRANEWEGAWGNSSDEWQQLPAVAAELGGKPRDGSFWMTFSDFCRGFNKVYVCRLVDAKPWQQTARLVGEFGASSAGGRLAPVPTPASGWRTNPQFALVVQQHCSVLMALSQPDALLDANDALDGYPNAIGFTILAADANAPPGSRRLMLAPPGEELRLDSRLCETRQVSAVFELDPGQYVVVAYTEEPNIFQPFALSAAATGPITLDELHPSGAPLVLIGSWDAANKTAGGCPNNTTSWTGNPQFALSCDAPCTAIGVLSLALDAKAADAMEERVLQLTQQAQQAQLDGDAAAESEAQAQLAQLAPAIGFLVLHSADGSAISGARELSAGEIVSSSAYMHGTQEVTALIQLPQAGSYVLVATTFEPAAEAKFTLALHPSTGALPSAKPLARGCEVTDVTALTRGGASAARPQVASGPPEASGKRVAPPASKVDISSLREADGDDGKIGYAQRMEMEEAKKLDKWPENVPLMTIEGQPLSENVKKEKERLVNKAMQYCWATGGKFEDSGPGGFPSAPGRAEGRVQPAVYKHGEPSADLPVVTQWLRPEEFCNMARPGEPPPTRYMQPMLFKSMYEIESIIQAAGFDNRWFISALNIVASNRGQLERIFFGEIDPTWVEYGFFVCKFYKDDPMSDDDWQVVLIDDRIPCDATGTPAFCRNPDPTVYWSMIVEKAYAKFAGCYEAMQGGTVVQGLEDLTGGIGYKFALTKGEKEWIPPKGEMPERLWDEMMEKMKTEHVIGVTCNTKGQPRPQTTKKGIELNRAYAVVTGGDFEDIKLMRLRIPLNEDGSCKEWNGKWSDNSGAWTSRMMQMLHYSRDANDGTFWMEYADLCKHFNKVYMCRMLDDLWTRFAVKSRWMDETAGGCTNFISWRNNNQWLLTISRPNTKLIIKLAQPDARKSMGNGRHYSNAIGFYILKGNTPNAAGDHKRRKLIAKDGDEEDGGDFVFCKEPRFSRQVVCEYTFETASDTPYVLVPYMFEPGREAMFKLTILSDDRDDDGEADFGFADVKPADDWKRSSLVDSWSNGGEGNQLGVKRTAGGPISGGANGPDGKPYWTDNIQYQLTVHQRTRVFVFLEMLNVKTDMRDVEGLQTEPAYPTVGFSVYGGRGNHIKLDASRPLELLHVAPHKRGDGVYLELGPLDPSEDKYVIIPYTSQPGVEHKYTLTVYSDYEHVLERINPRLDCPTCSNPSGMNLVLDSLDWITNQLKRVLDKEKRLQVGDDGTYSGYVAPAPPKPKPYFPPQPPLPHMEGANLMAAPLGAARARGRQPMRAMDNVPSERPTSLERKFKAADMDRDGLVDLRDATDFVRYHQKADVDGDGLITEDEAVRYIKPLEERLAQTRAAFEQGLAQIGNDVAAQEAQIESCKQRLRALGIDPDNLDEGELGDVAKSRSCAVM